VNHGEKNNEDHTFVGRDHRLSRWGRRRTGYLHIAIHDHRAGARTLGIALIPAIGAIILLFMSCGGSGTSACPGCQSRLIGLSTKSNDGVLCGGCNHYLEGNGGSLFQTDENRISDVSLFSSPLPAQFSFPGGCCVCGKPEAGLEKISLRNQNASSAITAPSVGVTTSTIVSVEVPHCAEHKKGAQLTGTPQRPHIKFRS
jgi:hypothetical protein